MGEDRGYSDSYEDALRLAATVHARQSRKGTDIPYVTHLCHVSVILLDHGYSKEIAIAGLLHDVVEDQGYDLVAIEKRFGPRVAGIVAALSEDKLDADGRKRPWEVRKQGGLAQMRQAGADAVAVKVADTLHNARTIALDARREGTAVWQRFTERPLPMLAHYHQILEVARERMGGHALVQELTGALEELAQVAGEAGVVTSPVVQP
jgi:(p)ppGpp synthase/HD superfamily hydrolase